jgi:hypothetical protein
MTFNEQPFWFPISSLKFVSTREDPLAETFSASTIKIPPKTSLTSNGPLGEVIASSSWIGQKNMEQFMTLPTLQSVQHFVWTRREIEWDFWRRPEIVSHQIPQKNSGSYENLCTISVTFFGTRSRNEIKLKLQQLSDWKIKILAPEREFIRADLSAVDVMKNCTNLPAFAAGPP